MAEKYYEYIVSVTQRLVYVLQGNVLAPLLFGAHVNNHSHNMSLVMYVKKKRLHLFRKGTHLTKVPCSMRLNISVGDTSMKRRKEKQLPSSSAKGCEDKVINKYKYFSLKMSTQAKQTKKSFVGL